MCTDVLGATVVADLAISESLLGEGVHAAERELDIETEHELATETHNRDGSKQEKADAAQAEAASLLYDLQKEVGKRRNFAIISHPDAGKTTLVRTIGTKLPTRRKKKKMERK